MAGAVGAANSAISASATTVSTTGVTTTASGSTFLIGCAADNAVTINTPTDSNSNAYSPIDAKVTFGASSLFSMRWFYCQNGTGGAAHTATFTTSAASVLYIGFLELTGVLTSGVLGAHNAATSVAAAAGGGLPSPVLSLTAYDSIVVAFEAGDSTSGTATHTAREGFSIISATDQKTGTISYTGCLAVKNFRLNGNAQAIFTEVGGTNCAVAIAEFQSLNPLPYVFIPPDARGISALKRRMAMNATMKSKLDPRGWW
ncbi:MAG: hypothetical protein U1F35_05395 [Steroidobacteraceae bacterium]